MNDERVTPPENASPAQVPTGPLDKKRIGLLALAGVIVLLIAVELLGHLGKSGKPTSNISIQTVKPPPVTKDVIGNFEKQAQQEATELARLHAQKEALDKTVSAIEQAPSPFSAFGTQSGQAGINDPALLASLRQQQVAIQQQQIAAAGYYPATNAPDLAKQEAAERKKQELQSLRSSNVALDLRSRNQPNTATIATAANQAMAAPSKSTANQSSNSILDENAGTANAKPNYDFNSSKGKQYRLFEGKIIETVLTNRINGAFSGPIDCMVTTDVYGHDNHTLLIPQGSRVLGRVSAMTSGDQQRLFVAFHRIIMPDGYSVHLDKFAGLNVVGETGVRDIVNHHYIQIFGASIALAAIGGVAQMGNTFQGIGYDPMVSMRAGISRSMAESSHRILDHFLNQLPTFIVRERSRVKIYLSNDLLLPSYANHTMPSDL